MIHLTTKRTVRVLTHPDGTIRSAHASVLPISTLYWIVVSLIHHVIYIA
nr:MAG TPA: hypothetical protein [Caudoviricetes sp.]